MVALQPVKMVPQVPVVVLLKQETIVVKVVVKLHLAVMEPLQVLILAQLLDLMDQLQEDGFLVVDKVQDLKHYKVALVAVV
jgi:hypothetical protein